MRRHSPRRQKRPECLRSSHSTDLSIDLGDRVGGESMGPVTYDKEITAVLVIDPYNDFISEGVVSHATDLVEHPALVANRLITFAEIVGRENVIAGTDCGLGGRVHPQIAWAKLRALRALRDGAAIASKKLWS